MFNFFAFSIPSISFAAMCLVSGPPAFAAGPSATQTQTTLSVDKTTIDAGTPVTLTAIVSAGQSNQIKGTVYFCNAQAASCVGINRLGEAQLDSNRTAKLTLRPGIGAYVYTAKFSGTSDYASSTSTPPVLVSVRGKYPSQTTLGQPTENGPTYNFPVTVTGYEPANAGFIPTGTVDILDTSNGDYKLGSVQLPATAQFGLSAETVTLPAGTSPYSMASADFNADGIADTAIANRDSLTIMVYLGTTDGQFQRPPLQFPTSGTPFPVVTGDFDNNGTADIAFGDGSNITVLPGDGKGAFGGAVNSPASDFSILVPGDFNRDGDLDLAVVHSANLQVYVGNGQNSFGPAPGGTSVPPGNASKFAAASAATGDVNNDGLLDLIVPDGSLGGRLWILRGREDGTFEPNSATLSFGDRGIPQSVAIADFDGNGQIGFAVGVKNTISNSTVEIYQGTNNGTAFTKKASFSAGGASRNVTAAIGDFNADGIADVAAAIYSANQAGPGLVQVWPGTAGGNFTSPLPFTAGSSPLSTVTGDFNGDGFTDAAVANAANGGATVGYMRPTVTSTTTAANIPAPLGTGVHNIVGAYSGDTNFAASTSNLVPVNAMQIPTETTLDPSGGLVSVPFTLTATVAPAFPTPAGTLPTSLGTVLFTINGKTDPAGPQNLTQVGTTTTSMASRTFQAADLGDSGTAVISAAYTPASAQGSPYAASISGTSTYLLGFKKTDPAAEGGEEQPSGK